ncbi:MAG: DUF2779 domain-containing protein [Bacteroidales bacterium]|nr:DUF2779 domain-containing protein [Bacteroidales bacterium]
MTRKHIISKSSFLRGKQCLKKLYLVKKYPELQDPVSEGQQSIFDRGHHVGELAQQLFPGGFIAAFDLPHGFMRSIKYTRELIRRGTPVIYEAGLMFENTHCFVVILKKENGKWHINEVKSSTEVKDVYIYAAAFQYHVLSSLGLEVADVSIVFVNNQYVREGEIDIQQLFTIESVYDRVLENQALIRNLLSKEVATLLKPEIPNIDIGPHCGDPYDCSFMGYCWKDIPEYSVFNISRLRAAKKFELYNNGILETTDVPESYSLNTNQLLQVHADKTGETIINKQGIKDFLSTLKYPLYFLDFETFNPAVPLYDYSKPYQQIVFQYSLHILNKPGGQLQHTEFLAQPTSDPRIPLIEQLISEIGTRGDIVVYNKGFETARLNEIAKDFPQYEPATQEMLPRIVDLMSPFQQKLYYTPEMKGSYSIKYVLPALVPGFSYANLEFKNGGDASIAFENILNEKDQNVIDKTRKNLLEYCKLDTLAMVEIIKVLEKY